MREITIFLLVGCISLYSFGQTTIASQGFENSGNDTWSYVANPTPYIEAGQTDIWSPITTMLGIKDPHSGDQYWGMRDLRNNGSGGDFEHTLHFNPINVTGKSNLSISFYYNTVNFGANDYIRVEFFYDGTSQGIEDLAKDSRAWKLFSKVIPDGTSVVEFTVIAKQNGSTEYAGLDTILLQSGADISPKIVIESPENNASIPTNSAGFDISFSTTNFALSQNDGTGSSDSSGDGYITYSLNGGPKINKFGSDPLKIKDLTEGNHSIELSLVDNNGVALNPEIKTSLTFSTFDIIESLPFSESFNYPVDETLDAQHIWVNDNSSNDNVLIEEGNLSFPGLQSPEGNSISFDGSGADPYVEFETISSGQAYFSFVFKVTNVIPLNDDEGGYFALFRNKNIFESRVWLKRADFSSFHIGMSTGTEGTFTTNTFELNTPIFMVMSYNLTTGVSNLWVNPSPNQSAPIPTLSETTDTPATAIDNFLIRQGFSGETPFIVMDELKIGRAWSEVTNIPLSTNELHSRNMVPLVSQNPVQNGILQFLNIDQNVSLAIFDVLGHTTLAASKISDNVDISHLTSGVYLAQFYRNSKIIGSKKIIVH